MSRSPRTVARYAFLTLCGASGAAALVIACGAQESQSSSSGACGAYFDVAIAESCNGASPPASEAARVRSRFITLCEATLALPGQGFTAAELQTCATALEGGNGCRVTPQACAAINGSSGLATTGTLGAGAACFQGTQCQTGQCSQAPTTTADGGLSLSSCGVCSTPIPDGQPCGVSAGSSCGPNSICTSAPGSNGATCAAITLGDVGAACPCKTGLACYQGKCAAPGGASAACQDNSNCVEPFVCLAGACQSPAQVGGACPTGQECAQNLLCDPLKRVCITATWASAGQACSGSVECLVGACPPSGVCPAVIADGQPCSRTPSTTTCDTFSSCLDGTCSLVPPTCK